MRAFLPDYQVIHVSTLDEALEMASDTIGDPIQPLNDMLGKAIESYEMQDEALANFVAEAETITNEAALIGTLMDQHNLTGNDLPEIGDKTIVSKIINNKRQLTRTQIENLSARFGLSPALFFDLP